MMKARKLFLGAAVVAVAATVLLVACNKNLDKKGGGDRALTAGILATCDCPARSTTDSTINTNINANLRLNPSKRYKLKGLIFVIAPAILTIDSGVTIQGIKEISPVVSGGLVVTRGAKLIANGTASCPIIFTSDQGTPAPGDWCGVVLLGKAQTNNYPATVEGINSTNYPGIDLTYGSGSDTANNDNSGSLKYVRIEYGGYSLSTDNEINGLTLAGVGSGTTLNFIEVFRANDDAFEFFGGTVNAHHLLAVKPKDDMFDTDNGYSGTIDSSFGWSDTTVTGRDQSQSNGIENDNNATGVRNAGAPITHPKFRNITIVGVDSVHARIRELNAAGQVQRYGRAAHMRRASRFTMSNAILWGFDYGVSIDTALPVGGPTTYTDYTTGASTSTNSTLTNVHVRAYGTFAPPFGTGPVVGPWSIERNGDASTGQNFDATQYSVNGTNNGSRVSNNNPFNMSNPYFGPPSAFSTDISVFVPASGQASRVYGAFPASSVAGGTISNWLVTGNSCATPVWARWR